MFYEGGWTLNVRVSLEGNSDGNTCDTTNRNNSDPDTTVNNLVVTSEGTLLAPRVEDGNTNGDTMDNLLTL